MRRRQRDREEREALTALREDAPSPGRATALHAHERIAALHKQLGQLDSADPLKLPAHEPEIRPGPDLGPDLDMDFGW